MKQLTKGQKVIVHNPEGSGFDRFENELGVVQTVTSDSVQVSVKGDWVWVKPEHIKEFSRYAKVYSTEDLEQAVEKVYNNLKTIVLNSSFS